MHIIQQERERERESWVATSIVWFLGLLYETNTSDAVFT